MSSWTCCCDGFFKKKKNRIVILGVGDRSGSTSLALQIYFQQRVTALPSNTTEKWTINYAKEPRDGDGPSDVLTPPTSGRNQPQQQLHPRTRNQGGSRHRNNTTTGSSRSIKRCSSSVEEMADVYSSSRDESIGGSGANGTHGVISPTAAVGSSGGPVTPQSTTNSRRSQSKSRRQQKSSSGSSSVENRGGKNKKEKDVKLELMDVGREDRLQGFAALQPILEEALGVVLVFDATQAITDKDRNWLHGVLTLAPKQANVFLVCNKQDMKGAQLPQQLVQALGLIPSSSPSTQHHHSILPYPDETLWTCQPCVATHKDLDARSVLEFILEGTVKPMICTMLLSELPSTKIHDPEGGAQPSPPSPTAASREERPGPGASPMNLQKQQRLAASQSGGGVPVTTVSGHSRLLAGQEHLRSFSLTSTLSVCSSTTAATANERSINQSHGNSTPPPQTAGIELDDIRVAPPAPGTEDSLTPRHTPATPSLLASSHTQAPPSLLYNSPGKAAGGGGSSALNAMKRFRPKKTTVTAPAEDDGAEKLLDSGVGSLNGAKLQYEMVQPSDDSLREDEPPAASTPAPTGPQKKSGSQGATFLYAPPPQPKFGDNVQEDGDDDDNEARRGRGSEGGNNPVTTYLENKIDVLPKGEVHRKRLAKLGLLNNSGKPSPLLLTAGDTGGGSSGPSSPTLGGGQEEDDEEF